MRQRVLGTLTIGQAPRPDVVPIIDRYIPAEVRRIHRGALDGLSHAEIAARYKAEGAEKLVKLLVVKGQGHNYWQEVSRAHAWRPDRCPQLAVADKALL